MGNTNQADDDIRLGLGICLVLFVVTGYFAFIYYHRIAKLSNILLIDVTLSVWDIGTDTLYLFTEPFASPGLLACAIISYTMPMIYALYVLLGTHPKIYGLELFVFLNFQKKSNTTLINVVPQGGGDPLAAPPSPPAPTNAGPSVSVQVEKHKQLVSKISSSHDKIKDLESKLADLEAKSLWKEAGELKTTIEEEERVKHASEVELQEIDKRNNEAVLEVRNKIRDNKKRIYDIDNSIIQLKKQEKSLGMDKKYAEADEKKNKWMELAQEKERLEEQNKELEGDVSVLAKIHNKLKLPELNFKDLTGENLPLRKLYRWLLKKCGGNLDQLEKLVGVFFIMLIATILYSIYFIIALTSVLAVNICFWIAWVSIGTFGIASKALVINDIRSTWLSWWSGKAPTQSAKPLSRNMYHRSTLMELLVESIPQVVIQVINNVENAKAAGGNYTWSVISILSLIGSILLIVRELYPYAYWLILKRVELKEMPLQGHNPGDAKVEAEEDEDFGIERNWELPVFSKNVFEYFLFLCFWIPPILSVIAMSEGKWNNDTGDLEKGNTQLMMIMSVTVLWIACFMGLCSILRALEGGDSDTGETSLIVVLFMYLFSGLSCLGVGLSNGHFSSSGPRLAIAAGFSALFFIIMVMKGIDEELRNKFFLLVMLLYSFLSVIAPLTMLIISLNVNWGPDDDKLDKSDAYSLVLAAIVLYSCGICCSGFAGFTLEEGNDDEGGILVGAAGCLTLLAGILSTAAAFDEDKNLKPKLDDPGPLLALSAGVLTLAYPIVNCLFAIPVTCIVDEYKPGKLSFFFSGLFLLLASVLCYWSMAVAWGEVDRSTTVTPEMEQLRIDELLTWAKNADNSVLPTVKSDIRDVYDLLITSCVFYGISIAMGLVVVGAAVVGELDVSEPEEAIVLIVCWHASVWIALACTLAAATIDRKNYTPDLDFAGPSLALWSGIFGVMSTITGICGVALELFIMN